MNRFVVAWGDVRVYDVKFNVHYKANETETAPFGSDRSTCRNGHFIPYLVWSGR